MGLGSSTLSYLRIHFSAEYAGPIMLIWITSVAIWFSIFLERYCLIVLSRTVGASSSMALEGAPAWLALPTDAEMTAAPPLQKKGRHDDDNGGGSKSLRETVGTMGRLALADSREIQDLAAVVFRQLEVKQGGPSEQREATGRAYNAQSTVLREKGLTDGFSSMWKDVSMTFSPQQIAALVPYSRWKAYKGKPTEGGKDKGKGKDDQSQLQQVTTGSDKGHFMYAVEVTHADGPKLAALLGEAMLDMKAVYKAGAAPPGPLHRQLSKLINDM
ncbi:unnamed protein product [Prorocentrum cordatum]|uniref:Uncharacterized protein n=1 Tax=Prorocentrum cordatum TaxID=2364126 RepID=A0ABN9TC96_9DINO|nr:unnamed protein product [Polarella glacialis]